MPKFQSYNKATRAQTPDYVTAANVDNLERQARHERQQQWATEGIDAYGQYQANKEAADALRKPNSEIAGAPSSGDPTMTRPAMAGGFNAPDVYTPDNYVDTGPRAGAGANEMYQASQRMPPMNIDATADAARLASDEAVGMAAEVGPEAAAEVLTDTAADAGTDVVSGAGASAVPYAGALRAGTKLAQGDVTGALSSGVDTALLSAGPMGWAGYGAKKLLLG